MKREMIKKAIISICILVGGIVAGYLLMTLAYCIDIPESRYAETKQILAEEGYHPRELLRTGKSDYYPENYPDILDIGTDEYIFEYSLRNTDESSFGRALIKDYGRYWHGYVVFLRPLSLFFDLAEIRYINLGFQLFLFLVLIYLIYSRTKKIRYLLVAFGIYYIMGPNSLACNMQYSSIYYVAVLSGILAISLEKYFNKNNRYIYLFLVSGIATAYIDFLTYPLLAWGVPAAIVVAVYRSEGIESNKGWVKKVLEVITSAIMWIVGYLGMWAGKWFIGTTLSGISVFRQAVKETGYIVGNETHGLWERMESLLINWKHLSYGPFAVIFVIAFLCWAVTIVRKGLVRDYRIPAFSVMILSAPAWYVMAFVHTRGHHIFTWRITLTTVIAAAMIACLSADYSDDKEIVSLKGGFFRALTCAGCLALGLITYSLIPAEKQSIWNYNLAQDERIIPAGEENGYVMDFIPMYSHICSVDPIVNSDDYAGYMELILSDGSKVIDVQKISFDGTEDSNIKTLPVNWHLKKGNRYQITISTENMKENARTWVTNDTSQYEFDGEEAMGMRYTYYTHFTDKKAAIFFVLLWAVAWMVVGYWAISLVNFCKSKHMNRIE